MPVMGAPGAPWGVQVARGTELVEIYINIYIYIHTQRVNWYRDEELNNSGEEHPFSASTEHRAGCRTSVIGIAPDEEIVPRAPAGRHAEHVEELVGFVWDEGLEQDGGETEGLES